MLHEDEFKDIMEVYKQLRKEGVIFPARDPRSQHFIQFEGKKSPIFETIENNHIYEEPGKTLNPRRVYKVKETNFIGGDSQMDSQFGDNKFYQYTEDSRSDPYGQGYPSQTHSSEKKKGDTLITANDIDLIDETCQLMHEILANTKTKEALTGWLIRRCLRSNHDQYKNVLG